MIGICRYRADAITLRALVTWVGGTNQTKPSSSQLAGPRAPRLIRHDRAQVRRAHALRLLRVARALEHAAHHLVHRHRRRVRLLGDVHLPLPALLTLERQSIARAVHGSP